MTEQERADKLEREKNELEKELDVSNFLSLNFNLPLSTVQRKRERAERLEREKNELERELDVSTIDSSRFIKCSHL